jgi:Skp family chaperone for outer membrane proteins
MGSFRRDLVLPIGFAIAAAIVLVGHDAVGKRYEHAPATHVATVNLAEVFDRIDINTSWEVELNTLADTLNKEAASRQEAIQRIRDNAALMKLELDEWAKLKSMELDRERALMWRTMYRSIREQAVALANADGWNIVLVNDSLGELQISNEVNVSREQQILTQILNRRMLFADESIDITAQIIVRINNLGR